MSSDKARNPQLFDGAYGTNDVPTYYSEITLRDLFAGLAMAGAEANPNNERDYPAVARIAYETADAMLAERERLDG